MTERLLLPPYPNGWYAVSLSDALAPGDVHTLHIAGEEVILFRTQAGQAVLMDAYCPHLGAHLGHGGTVQGEHIRCPFHNFEFDAQGQCVATPYKKRLPPKATAIVYPVQESHGLILAYVDRDRQPPTWHVPALDTAGWTGLRHTAWTMRGHPQETTENSVDIGHFTEIHGYDAVEILKPLVIEGHYLTTKYAMTRTTFGMPVRAAFEIHVYGLGYSQVDVEVEQFGMRARLFVLATPTADQQICLRLALSLREEVQLGNLHPLLNVIPVWMVRGAMAHFTFAGFKHDVEQDIPIWQHKRYIQPPILAEGDGPVGRYRYYARQFYPEPERVFI